MHIILKRGHLPPSYPTYFICLYMNINTFICSFIQFYRHADQDSDGHISFKDFENVISYGLMNICSSTGATK